jgi:hypothetical protein
VTNAEIVLDPDGTLPPGAQARIPFDLTEADYGADAIVLTPAPWALDFRLETPAGAIIDHHALGGVLGVHFDAAAQLAFYRLSLPTVVHGSGARQGRWHVLLDIGKKEWKKYLTWLQRQEQGLESARLGVPYSVVVHARSSLTMAAYLTQTSYVPGTVLNLRAVLTEIGLPVERRANVRAEVKRPDGTQTVVKLAETEPGVFEGSTPAPLSGVYPVRFRATGRTLRGFPFSREQTRTGLAWRGGDGPDPGPGRHSECPCSDLLRCLLAEKGIRRWLETQHIDPRSLEECLEKALKKNQ